MFGINNSGSQRLTADGAIGKSGSPIRLFGVEHLSGAGGAGQLVLRNGTAAGDTAYVTADASAASVSDFFEFGSEGLLFPDGCFFDKDANTAAIVAQFRVEA